MLNRIFIFQVQVEAKGTKLLSREYKRVQNFHTTEVIFLALAEALEGRYTLPSVFPTSASKPTTTTTAAITMHLQYKRHPTALEIDKRRQKFIPTFVDDDDDVAADVTHDGVIR